MTRGSVRNIIIVSDTHCGDRTGLVPDTGAALDDGGRYEASALQRKMWERWRLFWDEWVPRVTRKQPYILIHNGDAVDGVHHNSTSQISQNLADQANIAYECLAPLVDKSAFYYHIRGTEAHVGKSGAEEERLAQRLGALADDQGNHARWELWLELWGHLINFSHHIGTSGSSAYEATAVGKEMVEAYVEAGRWGNKAPQVIVRGHRHRYGEWRMFGQDGLQITLTVPSWQLKTAFSHRMATGRLSQPQLGGALIRVGDEELHSRAMVWPIERPRTEVYGGHK